jgi:hypothetical protein
MRTAHPDILAEIAEKEELTDDLIERLRDATDAFKAGSQWAPSAARPAA